MNNESPHEFQMPKKVVKKVLTPNSRYNDLPNQSSISAIKKLLSLDP